MSLNVFPCKQGEPDQNTKGAPISISPSSSSVCDNYGLNSLRSHDTSWNRGWIGLKFVNYRIILINKFSASAPIYPMTCSWSPSKVPGGRWELVHCTRCRVGGGRCTRWELLNCARHAFLFWCSPLLCSASAHIFSLLATLLFYSAAPLLTSLPCSTLLSCFSLLSVFLFFALYFYFSACSVSPLFLLFFSCTYLSTYFTKNCSSFHLCANWCLAFSLYSNLHSFFLFVYCLGLSSVFNYYVHLIYFILFASFMNLMLVLL